jgi:type I restriction enzyme S subunit
VFANAFKDEIVPQDPNDEPAEKLLARIQAEREKLKPAKKSGKP